MNKLIFLANNLQSPKVQKKMNLPLQFINFGIIKGRMYKYFGKNDVFVIPIESYREWGNTVIYGGIFLCNDFDFYSRILDAYHICSMSTLLCNHKNDIFHRVHVDVTPIYFETLDELARLKYKESKETFKVQTYIANINHPKINNRLNKTNSYRVIDGLNAEKFKELFWEVNSEILKYNL